MDFEIYWVLIFSVCSIVAFWLNNRKKRMSILERCGIPGPKPNLFTGNLFQYESMANVLWDSYLIQTYGKIVGYYLGTKPVVLVADPKLLKKIQRSDADKFLERPRRVPGGINPDPHRALMLGNVPVPKWIQLRKTLAPSFNPINLKAMTSDISTLVDRMLLCINTDELDFFSLFQRLTLDIIGKTGFGIDSNILENPNDPLLAAVAAEFLKSTNSHLVRLYLCLPELSFLLHPIRIWWERLRTLVNWSSSALWDQGRFALMNRNLNESRADLLQSLISVDPPLTCDQIVANSVLFFEAAHETLSSGLAFMVHLLVHHQDVQEKLREEVSHLESLDFDSVKQMHETEKVIKESLRLFPPQTTFIGRSPSVDYAVTDETGEVVSIIPKGTHVQVALFQIQRSAEAWENPEQFDPDRFDNRMSPDDSWQPFGVGRRDCIGKGFANVVMKVVLAKLLREFQLDVCEKTEDEGSIQIHFKTATMTPKNGSWAKVTRLHQ